MKRWEYFLWAKRTTFYPFKLNKILTIKKYIYIFKFYEYLKNIFFCACWKISLDNIIYFCLYVFINKIFSFRHIASKNLDEMAIFQCIIKFFSALYYIQEITCLIAPVLHYRLNRAYAWSCTVFTTTTRSLRYRRTLCETGIPVPDFEPRYDISPPFTTHLLINAGPWLNVAVMVTV